MTWFFEQKHNNFSRNLTIFAWKFASFGRKITHFLLFPAESTPKKGLFCFRTTMGENVLEYDGVLFDEADPYNDEDEDESCSSDSDDFLEIPLNDRSYYKHWNKRMMLYFQYLFLCLLHFLLLLLFLRAWTWVWAWTAWWRRAWVWIRWAWAWVTRLFCFRFCTEMETQKKGFRPEKLIRKMDGKTRGQNSTFVHGGH